MDIHSRVLELSQKGYVCSQIIIMLILETMGSADTDLVNAMHGLGGGVGYSGHCCGCMTGGCCALSLFFAKENDDFTKNEDYWNCLREFTQWFKDTYGSSTCKTILGGDKSNMIYCSEIISSVLEKCFTMLANQGFI